MKKFKTIYYIVYLVIIVSLFFIGYNLVDVLDKLRSWGWYTYFSELPVIGTRFIYFVIFLMVFQILVENFHLFKVRSKISALEREVLRIKAKLYDQSEAQAQTDVEQGKHEKLESKLESRLEDFPEEIKEDQSDSFTESEVEEEFTMNDEPVSEESPDEKEDTKEENEGKTEDSV